MSNSCSFPLCLFIAAPGEAQSAKNPATALDIFAFLCQKFERLGPGRWWSLPSKFITSEPDVLLITKITAYQNFLFVTTVPGISFQSTSKVYMDSHGLHGDRNWKCWNNEILWCFRKAAQRRQDASAVLVDKTRDCDLRRRLSAWDSLCMLLITSSAPASMTSFQVWICALHKPLFQS